jgi:SH3 domain-containing YSC84-like protein 1
MLTNKTLAMAAIAPLLALALCSSPAMANERVNQTTPNRVPGASAEQTQDAQQLVDQATKVVNKMKADPNLSKYMEKAKGIYIVPEFGRGALVIGGRGGAGVMLAHQNGMWSDPAFFDFGAISLGPQVGVSEGSVAFLLMTEDAVKNFRSGNVFSLNAGAGLSIITYSANAQASLGKGDIIFWSDTGGAYIGATISLSDIASNDQNNRAFYGKEVTARRVLSGDVTNSNASQLKSALTS